DNQVMCGDAVEPMILVGFDSAVLLVPFVMKHAHRTADELRQIPIDEPRVLASDFYIARKTEVIAHTYRAASNQPSRERFVVTVSEPEHPAIIVARFAALDDLHDAEVA